MKRTLLFVGAGFCCLEPWRQKFLELNLCVFAQYGLSGEVLRGKCRDWIFRFDPEGISGKSKSLIRAKAHRG